jgi:hypothetical protein
MALLVMCILALGLSLAGSRAVLWTVLFFTTRQIVRNVDILAPPVS